MTRWLSKDEQDVWKRMAAVLELLPAALDGQLTRDEDLTHFEYFVLASLSEVPGRTLRITALASQTNATLPRLSRVLTGLEKKAFVERSECSEDRRAKNVTLTETGWDKLVDAAPGHVEYVRGMVFDQLTPEQVAQLSEITTQLLKTLDPEGRMFASLGK
ncbi:MarR family winged helix-turn-helix transcriptional regulator [Arthrobacter tumbae]|uniref:MarR family winged helix-turn-helix transcriptional regulator n=1 Tax=Arthrobacter tumbae TaxID=163874 RepID=UPI00195CC03C|nr:MarR family transcriptional regulator [Arthrobacter tumbae]MBM7782300.1 DNA-binding MarR family transcriptional regulator [Arthrobacter tumbae]